jgi:hypothetical protein
LIVGASIIGTAFPTGTFDEPSLFALARLSSRPSFDARVAGPVYIAALAPDDDETSQGQLDNFPTTPVFRHIEVTRGASGSNRAASSTSQETCPT